MNRNPHRYGPRWGIWDRWLRRNGMLLFSPLWIVVALTVALPVFHHTDWLIGALGLMAIAQGAMIGGVDRTSGLEEYMLSLPPSRREHYWVRALLGLVIPASALLGMFLITREVSPRFWNLYCSSGWNAGGEHAVSAIRLQAAWIVPSALFAVTYAGASLGGLPAGILSALLVGALSGTSALIESLLWQETRGWVVLPVLGVFGVLALLGAYPLYVRRDGVSGPQRNPSASIAVMVIFILIILFVLMTAGVRVSSDISVQPHGVIDEAEVIHMSNPHVEKGGTP